MKPIHLTLHASYRLLIIQVLAGLFSSAMCLWLPVAVWLKIMLMLTVLTVVMFSVWRHALLLLPQSVVAIKVSHDNQLHLVLKNGQAREMLVQDNTVVTAYLTVINCLPKTARVWQAYCPTTIVILPDATDVESFRQLRVWLRWAKRSDEKQMVAQTTTLDSAEDKMA